MSRRTRALLGHIKSPIAKAGLLLIYASGARISEAVTLEVTAFDSVNGLIYVGARQAG